MRAFKQRMSSLVAIYDIKPPMVNKKIFGKNAIYCKTSEIKTLCLTDPLIFEILFFVHLKQNVGFDNLFPKLANIDIRRDNFT